MNTSEKLYCAELMFDGCDWEFMIIKATSLENAFETLQKNHKVASKSRMLPIETDLEELDFEIFEMEKDMDPHLCAVAMVTKNDEQITLDVDITELEIPDDSKCCSIGYSW